MSFFFFARTFSRRDRLESLRDLAERGGVSKGDSRGLLVITLTSCMSAALRARDLKSEAEFRAEPETRIMGMTFATLTFVPVESLTVEPAVFAVLDLERPEKVAARASGCGTDDELC